MEPESVTLKLSQEELKLLTYAVKVTVQTCGDAELEEALQALYVKLREIP